MKKLKFFKNFLSVKSSTAKLVNGWIIRNRHKLTSYQFLTAYAELGDGGQTIGDDIDLVYTTKNNKPIPSYKKNK